MVKKRVLYAVLVVVLFIPTFFAIASYHSAEEGIRGNTDLVTEISVYDTNGTLFSLTERSDMDLFLSFLKDSAETAAVPAPVKEASSYRMVYKTADGDNTYKFYFSLNPGECYYEDLDGKAYQIRADQAEKFLLTEYAACVYGDVALPVLRVGGAAVAVTPNTFEWQYRLYDGNYRKVSNIRTSDVTPTVSAPNTLGISFTDDPGYLFLKVTERATGAQLYEGMIDSFRKVSVSGPTEVLVELDARWYDSDSHPNYGSGTYSFYTTVGPDIAFSISSTTVRQGGAVLVSALNASSAEDIRFSCEPALNVRPVFYMDGDVARALIPFTYEATESAYTLTFSYGDVTVSETITVQNQTYGTKAYSSKPAALSTDNQNALSALINEILSLPSENTYLGKETFVCGTRDAKTRTGYGTILQFSDGTSYRHLGSDQSIAKDDWVKAVNDGKVIYVGSDPILGGIVVVDHGMGVKSWYCRVGRVSVKVGDTVAQGEVIARSDFSGFGDDKRIHSMLSVGDSFISLDVACDGGIRFN